MSLSKSGSLCVAEYGITFVQASSSQFYKKISAKKELLTFILMYNSYSFGSLEIKGFSLFMDIGHNTPLVKT